MYLLKRHLQHRTHTLHSCPIKTISLTIGLADHYVKKENVVPGNWKKITLPLAGHRNIFSFLGTFYQISSKYEIVIFSFVLQYLRYLSGVSKYNFETPK